MRFSLLLWIAWIGVVSANDYEPARLQWSLNNDPHIVFDSLNAAIETNCAQLKSNPPPINNVNTAVIQCGQIGSTSTVTKRINVAYTLRLMTASLQTDKQIKSNFTLTQKASCSSKAFPNLQEDPSAAYRYTCWRCPPSERQAKPPRFVSDGSVRWFSSSQCPVVMHEQVLSKKTGQPLAPIYVPAALPPVLSLTSEDSVVLHVEKKAQQGSVVALLFNNGQRKFFIGDKNDKRLQAAKSSWGNLEFNNEQWHWLSSQGTRYVFEARVGDYLHIASKQMSSGERWQFKWQRTPLSAQLASSPNTVARLEWAIDQNRQRYSFFYDEKGEVSQVKIEGPHMYDAPGLTFLSPHFPPWLLLLSSAS